MGTSVKSFRDYVLFREGSDWKSRAEELKRRLAAATGEPEPPAEPKPRPLPTSNPVVPAVPRAAKPAEAPPPPPAAETGSAVVRRWQTERKRAQGLGGDEERVELPAAVTEMLTKLFALDVKVGSEVIDLFGLEGGRHHWVAPNFNVTASRVYPFYRHSDGSIHSVPGFRVFDITRMLSEELREKKEREKRRAGNA